MSQPCALGRVSWSALGRSNASPSSSSKYCRRLDALHGTWQAASVCDAAGMRACAAVLTCHANSRETLEAGAPVVASVGCASSAGPGVPAGWVCSIPIACRPRAIRAGLTSCFFGCEPPLSPGTCLAAGAEVRRAAGERFLTPAKAVIVPQRRAVWARP
jgi:hypothetical protein